MESTAVDPQAVEPDGARQGVDGVSFDVEDMQPKQILYPDAADLYLKNGNEMDTSVAAVDFVAFGGCETTDCHEGGVSSTSVEHETASLAFLDGAKVHDESTIQGEASTEGFNAAIKPEELGVGPEEETMEVEGMKVAEVDSFPTTPPNYQEYDHFIDPYISPYHKNSMEATDSNTEFQGSNSPVDTSVVDINHSESFLAETFVCEDSIICEETVTSEKNLQKDSAVLESPQTVSKVDMSSEDEGVNLYTYSGKSGAESCSSKDESPSGPSCSGTSRAGVNSLSSDSEDDLSRNFTLPPKKRKRDTKVEVLSSSSCSEEDDDKSEIDYSNLSPEEIKALIEEAKRYGTLRKCKCPKKKWSELPVQGPTETSTRCTIGKGDWSEKSSVPCEACSAGSCTEAAHKRRARRRGPQLHPHPRSILARTRARGTIGQDVPVIDLSDSEDASATPQIVSEVTIKSIPVVPPGEFIVLSSSEDDDDIVCEGVVKTEKKNRATGVEILDASIAPKNGSPDVVVLNASTAQTEMFASTTQTEMFASTALPEIFTPPAQPQLFATATQSQLCASATQPEPFASTTQPQPFASMPPFGAASAPYLCPSAVAPLPAPRAQDPEWLDIGIDLDNRDELMNLLANIVGPPSTEGAVNNGPQANASANVPERPSSPEGWSCPICLESKTAVSEIMSTTCGHVFCGDCIRSAVKIHKKCPTCRKKLTIKQFHKIFL